MPLSDNSRFLISTLETLPLLDGRFQYLHLVNYDSAHDEKRGFFSLVFRAEDITDSRLVAIKFYDIDPRFRDSLRMPIGAHALVARAKSFKRS